MALEIMSLQVIRGPRLVCGGEPRLVLGLRRGLVMFVSQESI